MPLHTIIIAFAHFLFQLNILFCVLFLLQPFPPLVLVLSEQHYIHLSKRKIALSDEFEWHRPWYCENYLCCSSGISELRWRIEAFFFLLRSPVFLYLLEQRKNRPKNSLIFANLHCIPCATNTITTHHQFQSNPHSPRFTTGWTMNVWKLFFHVFICGTGNENIFPFYSVNIAFFLPFILLTLLSCEY